MRFKNKKLAVNLFIATWPIEYNSNSPVICQKEVLPIRLLLYQQYLVEHNDIMSAVVLKSRTQYPSWGQIRHQSAGCDCAGLSQPSSVCSQLENNKGRSWGKEGKEVFQSLAFPGSNHRPEQESRPLRSQPVRELWEGAQTAQAVLFIKNTHHAISFIGCLFPVDTTV